MTFFELRINRTLKNVLHNSSQIFFLLMFEVEILAKLVKSLIIYNYKL